MLADTTAMFSAVAEATIPLVWAQTRPKAGLIHLCEFQTLTHSFKF